jgi:hypothetical protein
MAAKKKLFATNPAVLAAYKKVIGADPEIEWQGSAENLWTEDDLYSSSISRPPAIPRTRFKMSP